MVIFTDLDGTLLNHYNYEYQAVLPLLKRLKDLKIPVILNSSKTLSELQVWREKLNLTSPVVAENGGVVLLPQQKGGERKQLIGKPYVDICSVLRNLRLTYGWKFEGFDDWTTAEVMAKTHLNFDEAVSAKDREVSEPILWSDSDLNLPLFKQALAEHDLVLKKGGRFYHVMGDHDKADAMKLLMQQKEFNPNGDTQSISLGDGENDLAMLKYADIAMVLPSASGKSLQVERAYYSKQAAPEGWVEAIETVL